MKIKSLVSVLLICGFFGPLRLSAQAGKLPEPKEFKPLLFNEISGAYAIYKNSASSVPYFIGIGALGGNQLVFRLYVPSTKTELLVTQTFYTVPNTRNPSILDLESGTIKVLRGDFAENDQTQRFLPMIYGWMDAWLHSRERFLETSEYSFDENGTYAFQYWIPVLQLKSVDSVSLQLAGVMESANDPSFFGYTGELEISAGPAVHIDRGTERTVVIDGLSIPLDSNWQRTADGDYSIASPVGQCAFFSVNTLAADEFGGIDTFELIKQILLYSGDVYHPENVKIFVSNEDPCVFFQTYDLNSRQISVQYKMFVSRDNGSLSVITLWVYESVYMANRDFFDAILF